MKFDKPNTSDPELNKLLKQVNVKLNALLKYKTFRTKGSKLAYSAFKRAVDKVSQYDI
jgi:hypothetical protein